MHSFSDLDELFFHPLFAKYKHLTYIQYTRYKFSYYFDQTFVFKHFDNSKFLAPFMENEIENFMKVFFWNCFAFVITYYFLVYPSFDTLLISQKISPNIHKMQEKFHGHRTCSARL